MNKDHEQPFPDAGPIFKCEWCNRLIYVPHSYHYRLRGGCEAYARHCERAWEMEFRRGIDAISKN